MNFLKSIDFDEIVGVVKSSFPRIDLPLEAIEIIVSNAKQDKKNRDGEIKMVLIKSVGEVVIDVSVEEKLIIEALKYYIDSKH
jgi:3-dehydroquinate synthetase